MGSGGFGLEGPTKQVGTLSCGRSWGGGARITPPLSTSGLAYVASEVRCTCP